MLSSDPSTKLAKNFTKTSSENQQQETKEVNEIVLVQFQSHNGESIGPQLNIPSTTTSSQLLQILNKLLNNDKEFPYSFVINDFEIKKSIKEDYLKHISHEFEKLHTIMYFPQSLYKVHPVSRCSATLDGHTEAILCVRFSPDGKGLATGSGDTTIRLWDLELQTPKHKCEGHTNWVLAVEWSPDAKIVASGSMDNTIRLWDANTGKLIGKPLKGHKKWITALSFQPYHLNPKCNRLVSSSKDCTIRIWNLTNQTTEYCLSQHTMSITSCRWGIGHSGYKDGVIYTTSQDRSIKMWDPSNGGFIETLKGHNHWVNTIALNTDTMLRRGKFDHRGKEISDIEQIKKNIDSIIEIGVAGIDTKGKPKCEKIITGSDDFSLFIWLPFIETAPIQRLLGHRKLINHVMFSPDGRYISSASFDRSIKIWDSKSGKFLMSLRGHVGPAYQLCWSSDSRLVMSCSKDSTCKIWDSSGSLVSNLGGHRDEIYAVDWTPCGTYAASGGKDKQLKIWRC